LRPFAVRRAKFVENTACSTKKEVSLTAFRPQIRFYRFIRLIF